MNISSSITITTIIIIIIYICNIYIYIYICIHSKAAGRGADAPQLQSRTVHMIKHIACLFKKKTQKHNINKAMEGVVKL